MLVSKGKLKDFAKTLKEKVSFFEDVVMSALKKAEDTDDVVLRFYEPSGKRAKLKFRVDVELLNLLEDTIGKIDANKEIVFKPFEFKTFKLKK
jgi:alpha-mannosidase